MRKDYQRPKKALKVLLETADGKTVETELMVFQDESLSDVMNGRAEFVEVRDAAGKSSLVAKSFIRRVFQKADDQPQTPDAAGLGKLRLHAQDPYLILDVATSANDEDVRNAYLKLVRAYHPDKLASMELPPAILDYGEEILKKINAAYEAIMFKRRKPGSAA
jgi:DnaJ-domain-containing protein 1